MQQQVLKMISYLSVLEEYNGVVAKYCMEDEVRVNHFIKEVAHYVYFNLVVQGVRCSCGLFESREILRWHQLAIFKMNWVRSVSDEYILDQSRNDIKMTYTFIKVPMISLRAYQKWVYLYIWWEYSQKWQQMQRNVVHMLRILLISYM